MSTRTWRKRVRVGRFQLTVTVMRHHYGPHVTDRWVVQTSSVYDRKHHSAKEVQP